LEWIVTTGGDRSPISQVYDAGFGSTFPSTPLARTKNSCSCPNARSEKLIPEAHGAKETS
jgi:hypothetical protein